MSEKFISYLKSTTEAAPLAAFRILFGLMMFASIIRFWLNGWIEKLYIEPTFFFKYYGFEFVEVPGNYTYLLFVLCALSALGVALGFKYRLSIILFFLSFTYIELMDLTTYLNHYYFISLLSFAMIFLPANVYFSIDAYEKQEIAYQEIPKWCTDLIKMMLTIVYFYAGLAKLNSDWLLHAMPLSIWLPSSYDLPILGELFQQKWMLYFFSWAGAIFDLSIPFLLFWKRTRIFAFILVVVFHLLTRILFPIGMFPYIMIASTTIFFEAKWHKKVLKLISSIFRFSKIQFENGRKKIQSFSPISKVKIGLLTLFLFFQLLFPFRYLAYPGELFWTEEGFRFSWRVMLMEKAGHISFQIRDAVSNESFEVDNSEFLTSFQEKQMSTQPDMILQFAHFLRDYYESLGYKKVEIYAHAYVALNGRRSKPYISPEVNLAEIEDSFEHRTWLMPFEDEIKGL